MPTIPPDQPSTNGKPADFLRLFELFGVDFSTNGNPPQARAEACPFCGKGKFHLNTETGQYQCLSLNACGKKGNAYTFINWVHETNLETTSDDEYRRLKNKRDLPLQTLKRHALAWNASNGVWLIPYKSALGKVQNLTQYNPETGAKYNLPGLPLKLYGLDTLSSDPTRTLFVCEGPFDAIALDQHLLSNKSRTRYDILAVPSANACHKDLLKFLTDRTVRLCFDNDKAGRDGHERIAKLCRGEKIDCKLLSLKWPDGSPAKCDISDLVSDGVNIAEFTRKNCVKVAAQEHRILFVRGNEIQHENINWLMPGHIPFATFVSLSGQMGTQKSTIAKDLAARATVGLPMPNCKKGIDPFDVMYFTSEDAGSQVADLVRVHGGDLNRLHVHDIAAGLEVIDFLSSLEEIEAEINANGVRLVILDALNSFVGGDISTDSKARRTLSGRLQALARRTGACIIGIRNWGRMEGGTASQKSLGATSLSDVARCVMNTAELEPDAKGRRFQLEFEKVSSAPKPEPIGYRVESLAKGDADSHLRRIVWEKASEQAIRLAKSVAKKGSSSNATR